MPKNILKTAWHVFNRACVFFTFLLLLVFVIGSAVPDFGNAIELQNVLVILLFSFLFAAANLLLSLTRLSLLLRVLLHYLATALVFFVVFILIAAKATSPTAMLVLLLFYTIVYAVLMGIYLFLFLTFLQRKKEAAATYENIYK